MGANSNVTLGGYGTTPLIMMACERSPGRYSLLMACELLEADRIMTKVDKQTALHFAESHRRGSDLVLLLTAKAAASSLVNKLDDEG